MTTEQLVARIEALEARVAELEGPLPPVDENHVGPSQRHSDTSKLAALHNFPRSGSQRARILDFLIDRAEHGATRQELAAALEMSDDSVRPRVVELASGGWVRPTDRTRRTPLGEQAEVVVASPRARLERLAQVEDTRQRVSPAPVVSEEPGAVTASGHASLWGQQDAPGSSETTAPLCAINDDWDAA